jgi:hypothetical protein
MLRKITLASTRDYPIVLRHLRDHCPNLRILTIYDYHLKSFVRSYGVLYSILERLERFSVLESEYTDADLTDNLLQLLHISDTKLNIKKVRLQYPVEDYARLLLVFSRLPALDAFFMPMDMERMEVVTKDFEFGESLELIGSFEIGEMDWFQFGLRWLNSKHSAKIGLNVVISADYEVGLCPGKDVSLFRLMYLFSNLSLLDFFKLDAFNKLLKPIIATQFIGVLTEGTADSLEYVLPVLELALSQSPLVGFHQDTRSWTRYEHLHRTFGFMQWWKCP